MKSLFRLTAIAVVLILCLMSFTHIKNAYAVGDVVGDFQLKNTNGSAVSLEDYKDAKGFIIAFTDLTCKQSRDYEERLILLNINFGRQGYPVIAINENGGGMGQLQGYIKKMRYPVVNLLDDNHQMAKLFGATQTPAIYILQKEAGKYFVRYIGAIDDFGSDAQYAKYPYAADAVNALLKSELPLKTVSDIDGCDIK
ncbi:MAG: alkyl hydroperoxide reductase/Thiol specific antioxidant/Mal allergen [Ferruginibacter sp.]|nr:alkyl hydroperoxide reductase/Thiol specific antioxidant/Mal allergen [Ferruginibacter sp.]